jgi:ribokinase
MRRRKSSSGYVNIVSIGQVTRDEIYDTEEVLLEDHVTISAQRTRIGGKAFNQAVATARMGARVSLVSAVGTDKAATDIRKKLEREGVQTDLLVSCSDGRRQVESVVVRLQEVPRGERKVIVRQSPRFAECYETAVGRARMRILEADIIIVTFELGPTVLKGVWATLQELKRRNPNAIVVLNPAPEVTSVKSIVKGLRNADIVVPNRWEARALVEHPAELSVSEMAREISEMYGPENVCITLGSEGASWVSQDKSGSVQGLKVELADKVGASDVFVGVLAIAFWQSRDFESSVRLANVAAAIAVGRPGGSDAAPTLTELLEMCRDLDRGRLPVIGPAVTAIVDGLAELAMQT